MHLLELLLLLLLLLLLFSAPLPTISKSDDTINELDKLKYTARNDELVSEHRVTCAGVQ